MCRVAVQQYKRIKTLSRNELPSWHFVAPLRGAPSYICLYTMAAHRLRGCLPWPKLAQALRAFPCYNSLQIICFRVFCNTLLSTEIPIKQQAGRVKSSGLLFYRCCLMFNNKSLIFNTNYLLLNKNDLILKIIYDGRDYSDFLDKRCRGVGIVD